MKEPSFPEVFPVFVRCLLGPHLVFHVSGCTTVSSLVSEVTARTGVPGHLFSFVVEGKVAGELTMNDCGVSKDMTLCMMARLRGGANPPSQRGTASGGAGQWFCVACQLGGCYAIRTRCFRCGLSRQESEQAMSGSSPSTWPLPPGPVHKRRQPRHVPPREKHYPARPLSGQTLALLQQFVLRGTKGTSSPILEHRFRCYRKLAAVRRS